MPIAIKALTAFFITEWIQLNRREFSNLITSAFMVKNRLLEIVVFIVLFYFTAQRIRLL